MSTITVNHQFDERLAQAAATTGKAPGDILSEALELYLEEFEDIRAADAVEGRLARGEEEVISIDELERRLELGD